MSQGLKSLSLSYYGMQIAHSWHGGDYSGDLSDQSLQRRARCTPGAWRTVLEIGQLRPLFLKACQPVQGPNYAADAGEITVLEKR